MNRFSDAEARMILDANQVTIMEDPDAPVDIVERLAGQGKIELPSEIGGVALMRDTTEGMTTDEIQQHRDLGAVTLGWGGIAIPINRTESQL